MGAQSRPKNPGEPSAQRHVADPITGITSHERHYPGRRASGLYRQETAMMAAFYETISDDYLPIQRPS